ncbi:MAG: VPLPA-CTERM sorting domain-containing protein, partial [Gammaproteobacteria bacterium]
EGTSLINPDLRVDFIEGAAGLLKFGFALNAAAIGPNNWASFEVYDANDNLLGSDFLLGSYTTPDGTNPSSFPEGVIEVAFSGLASYALFDFNADFGRYIIDNFEGTFGSTEDINPVPIPAAAWLFGSGLLGLVGMARRKRAA